MIPRYARKEAADIWSPQTRFSIMFQIEAHAADAMADLGVIPKEAARVIWEKGGHAIWDAERIDEIEREVKHDVIAFLTHVTEIVGPEARFLHQGMTSSDVNDTALAVQLSRATDLLIEDVDLVLAALKRRAYEHRMTPMVGRSHAIHAEPITFGLKLAGHYAEFVRAKERLAMAKFEIATCAISGAVGTFANVDPKVEEYVAEKLGLAVEPVSTQVIPRDRHAAYFAALGVVASSIERLATEIRHLQRTEVLEAEEPFEVGQKGSSARRLIAASTRSTSSSNRSVARASCTLRQVSSTSDEVMPWCRKRASGPTISDTWVRKAMTSCLVTASISSMRSLSHWASLPLAQMVSAASLGMVPSCAIASAAWASISNQIL